MTNSVTVDNKSTSTVEVSTNTTVESGNLQSQAVEVIKQSTLVVDGASTSSASKTVVVESAVNTAVEVAAQTSIDVLSHSAPTAIEVGVQGPQGPRGLPGTSTNQVNVVVPAGQSKVVALASSTNAVKWLVYGEDRLTGDTVFYEVSAVKRGGLVDHSVSNILGGGVQETEVVEHVGNDLQITIVNSGVNDLYYSLIEIGVVAW